MPKKSNQVEEVAEVQDEILDEVVANEVEEVKEAPPEIKEAPQEERTWNVSRPKRQN